MAFLMKLRLISSQSVFSAETRGFKHFLLFGNIRLLEKNSFFKLCKPTSQTWGRLIAQITFFLRKFICCSFELKFERRMIDQKMILLPFLALKYI